MWRALQVDPDAVAKWCDWPVNHADLIARKIRLHANRIHLLENLCKDETWFDAKLAGYWIWMASCSVGDGFSLSPNQRPDLGHGVGVHAQGSIPNIGGGGMGVHKMGERPNIANSSRPHFSTRGMGVHSGNNQFLTNEMEDVCKPYNTHIYTWFRKLSERLRYVRVVCGDWTRVCGGDWQANQGICGIFFDPPYAVDDRCTYVYGDNDSTTVANDVRVWCIERGARKDYRIVLAGYEEHEELIKYGWRVQSWSATGGYANQSKKGGKKETGDENRHREMLYFSPNCLDVSFRGLMGGVTS